MLGEQVITKLIVLTILVISLVALPGQSQAQVSRSSPEMAQGSPPQVGGFLPPQQIGPTQIYFNLIGHTPAKGAIAARTVNVSATFDKTPNSSTASSSTFTVRGQQTGRYAGGYSVNGNTLTMNPTSSFKPGELVTVNVNPGLKATDGATAKPYAWQFRAMVSGGHGTFVDSGQQLGSRNIRDLEFGDLNNDGAIDLFIAHENYPNEVWLNNGAGIFTNSGQSLGTLTSHGVALGDLDSDGDLDAFIANDGTNKIWLNNGSGIFSDSGQSFTYSNSHEVVLGDLDGDGDLDAWVVNYDQSNKLWLNNGSGVFSFKQSFPSANSSDVALGDIDNDGDLDAWVTNYEQSNKVWLNNGSATFSDSGQSLGNSKSASVALGDVDGDGDLDAVVANRDIDDNLIWLNNGSGIFTNNGQKIGNADSHYIALGDVDGDNDLDAFVANVGTQPNEVWLNNGSGNFTDSGQKLALSDTQVAKLGDVDGDGDLDVMAGNIDNQPNKLWLNQAYTCTAGGMTLCNADFEQGLTTHWETDHYVTLDTGHTGNYALKSVQTLSSGDTPDWRSIYQNIAVGGNQYYSYKAWLKWQNTGQLHLSVEWYDANGVQIGFDQPLTGTDNSGEWTEKGGIVQAPANAVMASIKILHGRQSGPGANVLGSTVWVDDISFVQLNCPDHQVCNGDFEQSLHGWGGTENTTITTGRTGSGVQVNYDGANSDIYQRLPGTFQAGKSYIASAWCKSNGTECGLFLGDAIGSPDNPNYENQAIVYKTGTGDWLQLTTTLVLTKDEELSLYLYARYSGNQVVYDDVTIQEVEFCSLVSEIPQTECEALKALYNSTNGANWTTKTGWLATTTPCSWFGVTCSDGRVTKVELNENNLTGTLPTEIGNLTQLTTFNLRDNQITGGLPSQVGSMVSLQYLLLARNQLSGSLPTQLTTLPALKSLDLYANQFNGTLPAEIGNLSNLTSLSIGINKLTGSIPVEIGNLSKLKTLYLHGNQLTGNIPSEFGNLTQLVDTSLSLNQLNGSIPSSLGNLTKLRLLSLYNNQLSGPIPTELGNMVSLQTLYLHNNTLTGDIPLNFANLSGVTDLDIGYNGLTVSNATVQSFLDSKDPDWATTQTVAPTGLSVERSSETSANVSWTPLPYTADGGHYKVYYATQSGGPYTLAGTTSNKSASSYIVTGLPAETTLYFAVQSYTPAHGSQQNDLTSAYSSEAVLYADFCETVSQIPLLECQALQSLYVSTSGDSWTTKTGWMSTTTPCSWTGITCLAGRVVELTLANNNLNGTIPAQLGDLAQLKALNLSQNSQLYGSIPTEIGQLSQLETLFLHDNNLSGSLPTSLGNLSNLQQLTLQNNDLTGSIPTELSNLSQLIHLNLSATKLTGSLPSELGNLTNLLYLHVNSNLNLSGRLPISLTNLNKLQQFSYNLTNLCTPVETAFQSWLQTVNTVNDSGLTCAPLTKPALLITPSQLNFTATFGAANPAAQSLNLSSSDGSALSWQASENLPWLKLGSASGSTPGTLAVSVESVGLAAGPYSGQLVINSNQAQTSTQFVEVSLVVVKPVLAVQPSSLSFNAALGQTPNPQTIQLTNSGSGQLEWTATVSGATWLTVTPQTGTATKTITVSVDSTGLGSGERTAEIIINSNGGSKIVPVTFNLTDQVVLTVEPTSLTFAMTEGGTVPANQTIVLSNSGSGNLSWSASVTGTGDLSWLNLSQTEGQGNSSITVGLQPQGLVAGRYVADILITSNGGQQTIPVILTITGEPLLLVSPRQLTYTAGLDSENPPSQIITLQNSGTGQLEWSVAISDTWLQVDRQAGSGPTSLKLTVDHTGLAEGQYTGQLQITSNGGSATIPVVLKIRSVPVLQLSPTHLNFSAAAGGSSPPSQRVMLTNEGAGTLTWQASTDAPWLNLSQTSGSAPVALDVMVNTESLTAGTYQAEITLDAGQADNSPQTIQVDLTISPPAETFYEPNDSCDQALPIATDGTNQRHQFDGLDQDWVYFNARAGSSYLIQAQTPPGSQADVVVQLYSQCGGGLETGQDYSFSPDVRLEFESPVDGPLYLRLTNQQNGSATESAYHLSVRTLQSEPTPGAVIILAGRFKPDDPLQENIYQVTDNVRDLFASQGYSNDRIYYLSPDTSRDHVNGPATKADLRYAITEWAKDKVGPDRALTLYLMDHGGKDKLYLDKPFGEWITPAEVDSWLSELETAIPGIRINIFVEACHSGSFIEKNQVDNHTQSLVGSGRLVVASTGTDPVAYASKQGAIFSDFFLEGLGQQESIQASFQRARWAAETAHPDQTPWLDADGNGLPNEPSDEEEAARRGFTFAGSLDDSREKWSPYIMTVTFEEAGQNTFNLRANVQDDQTVNRVEAIVYPPSHRPPESTEQIVPQQLEVRGLIDQGNDNYGVKVTGLSETGIYRIVVFAEDNEGQSGRPYAIEIPMLRGGQLVKANLSQTLTLTDTDLVTHQLHIPNRAITANLVLHYLPQQSVLTTPHGLQFAGRAFKLQAYQWGQLVTRSLTFSQPVSLTLQYDPAMVTGLLTETLHLHYWDGSAWATDGITLLDHDPVQHRLTFQLTHLTEFALFGQPKVGNRVYLPVVLK